MTPLVASSLLLLLAWPLCVLLLRLSQRYVLNRFALLVVLLGTVAVPFIDLASPAPVVSATVRRSVRAVETRLAAVPLAGEVAQTAGRLPETVPTRTPTVAAAPPAAGGLRWGDVYRAGLGLMLLGLAGRLGALGWLHFRSRPAADGAYRVLGGRRRRQAFTFGPVVYLGCDLPADPDFRFVLAHERVHARQWHSVDVLLAEVVLCGLWFHPVAWWLCGRVRANLEYLVDSTLVVDRTQRRAYQLALVRQSQAARGLAPALPFSEPSLRDRINRMARGRGYRTVAFVAAMALTFWLGLAASVLTGEGPPAQSPASWLTGERAEAHPPPAPPSAVPVIESFELHLRRLPTPPEMIEINALLSGVPNTKLIVYQPCDAAEGEYQVTLRHWLNQEYELAENLAEGEYLDYPTIFTLTGRGPNGTLPPEPHVSMGYYQVDRTPSVFEAVSDSELVRTQYKTREGWVAATDYPPNMIPTDNARPSIRDEGLVVFLNGERYPLQSTTLVAEPAGRTITFKMYGKDFELSSKPGGAFSLYVRTGPAGSGEHYATSHVGEVTQHHADLEEAVPLPPHARLRCLLDRPGLGYRPYRNVRYNQRDGNRAWFEQLPLPADRPVVYYFNNKPSDAAAVLDAAGDLYNTFQVGYNRTDPNGPVVVQYLNDIIW